MVVRSCLLESKSTNRCFVREYAFQLQKADLSWLWDKWKVWKMTILFCVSHHHTLNSKSNVFIEFLFPRLLGSRHVSIKVLVFWFSWKTSQNWLLQVFSKSSEILPKFLNLRQRMNSRFKVKLHALSHFLDNWPNVPFFQTNIKTWVFYLAWWKVWVEDFNTFVTSTQKLRKIKLAEPIWFGSQSVIVRNTK